MNKTLPLDDVIEDKISQHIHICYSQIIFSISKMVGAGGFEPPMSESKSDVLDQLDDAPIHKLIFC